MISIIRRPPPEMTLVIIRLSDNYPVSGFGEVISAGFAVPAVLTIRAGANFMELLSVGFLLSMESLVCVSKITDQIAD